MNDIHEALNRVGVRDHTNGIVTHGGAGCLCGGKLHAGGGPRDGVITHVATWVSRHIGEGHRIYGVTPPI